jgi:hypothetical protein
VRRVIRPLAVMLLAVVALSACQDGAGDEPRPQPSATTSPQVVSAGSLAAGQPVARPRGEVVLTMSGQIATHNQGRKLVLDLGSLERMRTVRLETTEPFLKRRVKFDGVMLADLLAVAGVPSSAASCTSPPSTTTRSTSPSTTSAARRCCWPPRPTASACRSTGPAPSGWCSRTAPASGATRTCGSGACRPCSSADRMPILDRLGRVRPPGRPAADPGRVLRRRRGRCNWPSSAC